MSTKTKNTYIALPIDSEGNTVSLPKDKNERTAVIKKLLADQGIPENAVAFFAPLWTLQGKWTGQDVFEAGLEKYVATLLNREFDKRETISFTIVFCAFLAQLIELDDQVKYCQWKALPNVPKGTLEDKQFTFQAHLPGPLVAATRHSLHFKTGALPTLDGKPNSKRTIWYPFVAQDTNVHYFNRTQMELLVKYGVKKDLEIQKIQAANKEAAMKEAAMKEAAKKEAGDKQFHAAIEAALQAVPSASVQLQIRPATEAEEKAAAIADLEKIEAGHQIPATADA